MSDGLAASYAGAFDGGLEPGSSPAVLVVDLVRAYLDESSPLYMGSAAAARDATGRLVEAAREHGVPVLWTAVRYRADGADGGRFFEKVPALAVFADGAGDLGDFPAEVGPADDEEVVVKQFPSGFFGTDLLDRLRVRGVDTVLVTGYSTSGCVRATVLDALCHGFVPVVVRDACADRDPRPHDGNLFDLQAKYAEVVDLSTALELVAR